MRKSVLLVILVLIYFFLKPTSVSAKTAPPDSTYAGYEFTITAPRFVSEESGGEQCPVSCDYSLQCANTENANNCNKPACPPGGNAWTTYNLNCVITFLDRDLSRGDCEPQYSIGDVVYSNGDKCTSGGPYLNPGYCESAFGGPIYRTCCSNTSNELSPFQCEPIYNLDNAGDIEGQCPAGYERKVLCNGDGLPACGQEACGSTGEPPPPPPETPPPVTPTPEPVCVANSWDSTQCTRCKADGSGYNANCSDFGPSSPSPGNDWCSCDQRCPGIDNPACTPTSSFVTQAPNPMASAYL